jgi:enterochelin esterase-like enzyme
MIKTPWPLRGALALVGCIGVLPALAADESHQAPPPAPSNCVSRAPREMPIEYDSIRQEADQRITFRLCAPDAVAVSVVSTELDGVPTGYDGKPDGLPMQKDDQGFWVVTLPRVIAPGSYRYAFKVGGVDMADPRGTTFSELARGVRSVFDVQPDGRVGSAAPGAAQGTVSEILYPSASLKIVRRAHIYTPPGYEGRDTQSYPVLVLLHGVGDSDDSWTSIGKVREILDGLIASGKAKPMIVVMPFAHTPARPGLDSMANEDLASDVMQDLVPYVDAHYRTLPGPATRAIAGLSMGGANVMNFGLTHPEVFGSVGIFSIGLLPGDWATRFVQRNEAGLQKRAAAHTLVFYAVGKTDFVYKLVAPTRQMLDEHHIAYVYHETDGGHTWANWRRYLGDFAPMLFR